MQGWKMQDQAMDYVEKNQANKQTFVYIDIIVDNAHGSSPCTSLLPSHRCAVVPTASYLCWAENIVKASISETCSTVHEQTLIV